MTGSKPRETRHANRLLAVARNVVASQLSSNLAKVSSSAAIRLHTAQLRSALGATGQLLTVAGSGGLLGKSYLVLVAFPSFLFWCYAALWQSERYVAEARLTVRAAQEQHAPVSDPASIIGKMSGGPKSTFQDSYIVLNYLKSRAIVLDLGGREYLERKYSGNDADYFSRLRRESNLEELWKYWTSHITASVDTVSGILTLDIEAFSPRDALEIAQDVVRLSEELINKITVRNRSDALARAELETSLSRQKLADAREKLLRFRNENALIDPGAQAASLGELIGQLTLERIDIESSLSTFSGTLSTDAPTQRVQKNRLAAIDQQIAELKKKLTDGRSNDTISAQIASYERLKLEEQFAEALYKIAQSSYQRARQDLETQQLYVVIVVRPTLPESATYPKIIANALLLFGALTLFWGIGALLVASINDHMV